MAGISLYTDNGCDLDRDILDSYGIKTFYLSTVIKGAAYQDRLTISPPDFYKLLEEPGVMPTTSQVNLADLHLEFSRVMDQSDDDIVYIALSSGLSGTYQTACIARDEVNPERITVIDSRSASVGQGLTVIKAAKALAMGKSKAEVLTEIEDHIKRVQHIFIVGNLEMLKRGGRISPAAARIGDLLSIKPILELKDGRIEPVEKVHGMKKAKKRLLDIVGQRSSSLRDQTIGLAYSQDLQGALQLKQQVEERFAPRDILVSEIGALIGAHVGPGTHGLFFLRD